MRPFALWAVAGVKLTQATRTSAATFSLVRAVVLLVVVFAVAFPPVAYYGHQAHGEMGVVAAGVAALVCLGAGFVALGFIAAFRQPEHAVSAVGLAMLFRMAIPMLAGVALMKLAGPLAEAGVFGMIVGFYLVGLFVETLLAVRLVSGASEAEGSKVA